MLETVWDEQEGVIRQYLSISIVTDPDVLSDENAKLTHNYQSYDFKNPSNAISVSMPINQLDELLPRFLPAHRRLMSNSHSKNSHDLTYQI